MVFSSPIFLFYFLPLTLLVYYNIPFRWRNPFLTIASYIFYGWWKPWFTAFMFGTTTLDHSMAKIIGAPGASRRRRRLALAASVTGDLAVLAFFKYFMFSAESLNQLLALVGADTFSFLRVTLPIGISFYTFKSISYTVDVYRGVARPAKSLGDYACFVSLFPQLMAGPIQRYHTVAEQLAHRAHTVSRFAAGTELFVLGLAKKILLANPMGSVADSVFGAEAPGALDAWFGAAAYTFQIYFDFCGYSDMAVGLGRMLGFEFMKNFDAPYRSESITEFWRRWHISLSTFLRDYLYIPLGGNRKGPHRTYANLLIVMLLGGLWHGAKWTFVAWGAYHGLWLCAERLRGKHGIWSGFPRPFRIACTFILVIFSWVLFRAESLTAACGYVASMFGAGGGSVAGSLLAAEIYTPYFLGVFGLCAFLVAQPVQAFDWVERPAAAWRPALILPLLFLAMVVMASQAFNPFLYFQF
jgi:alginate O-acetyltransferase complex protein AlgI